MQQYTFNIPNNSQAKELLNYILRSKIFQINEIKEIKQDTQIDNNISPIDFWEDLPASLKQSILESKEQARAGKIKSHSEITSKYKSWLSI